MTTLRMTTLRLSRREFAALLGAGGASAALGGLGLPEASASTPVAGSVCMIVRHGEKPNDEGRPTGRDEKGLPDSHSLTPRGWERARALGGFFASPRAGVVRPARIYAPGPVPGHAAGRRPRQTAVQIAAALGTGVDLAFLEGEERKLANQLSILGPSLPALVVWEHSAIPEILSRLDGPVSPKLKRWPDDRYDVVLVCRADKNGWRLSQVPQLLLPGDRGSGL